MNALHLIAGILDFLTFAVVLNVTFRFIASRVEASRREALVIARAEKLLAECRASRGA